MIPLTFAFFFKLPQWWQLARRVFNVDFPLHPLLHNRGPARYYGNVTLRKIVLINLIKGEKILTYRVFIFSFFFFFLGWGSKSVVHNSHATWAPSTHFPVSFLGWTPRLQATPPCRLVGRDVTWMREEGGRIQGCGGRAVERRRRQERPAQPQTLPSYYTAPREPTARAGQSIWTAT